ncbi:MAG: EF-P 5-aminopentanol modification-associated protein YfmH, partial [Oscillospiraceae bacterium]|jgi:predicted Zn-dependent peptidase
MNNTDFGIREERLPNGLTLRMRRMEGRTSSFALIGTRFGSVDREFRLGGQEYHVPAGTAHFLEHKMFDGPQKNAFDMFAETGANSNAYTSYDRTCFLFDTSQRFADCLRILAGFMQNPYITDKTVANEQKIIGEEIRMYRDSPSWAALQGLLGLLYGAHPCADDIAGSEESISNIDKDILYTCWKAFYRPDNMVLCTAGNICEDEIVDLCSELFEPVQGPGAVKTPAPCPRGPVKCRRGSRAMDVSSRQFAFGYREKVPEVENRYLYETMLELVCYMISGPTSRLFGEMYDSGLVNNSFDFEVFGGEGYLSVIFSGESSDPDAVSERIIGEIEKTKKRGFGRNRAEEAMRLLAGDTVCAMDDPEGATSELASAYFKNGSVYDKINTVRGQGEGELLSMLRSGFDPGSTALYIIEPEDQVLWKK